VGVGWGVPLPEENFLNFFLWKQSILVVSWHRRCRKFALGGSYMFCVFLLGRPKSLENLLKNIYQFA
jgi:hypothetical protein